MKIILDGKELIKSITVSLSADGCGVFEFGVDAKITILFKIDKSKNSGGRIMESIVDADGKGMTINCYNFQAYSPTEEGLIGDPHYIFTNEGKKHYITFRTGLFNAETRVLSVSFLKDC